jgi:hypothetical protein
MRPEKMMQRSEARQIILLATFRRKIDVFLGARSMGFGRAKTAGPPAVIFEGLWL